MYYYIQYLYEWRNKCVLLFGSWGENIMYSNIGPIVRGLRFQRGVTIQDISRGICTKSAYSRMENGEVEPDYFITKAIFQRLDGSIEKLEIIISDYEYDLIDLQDCIKDTIALGKDALALLKRFESQIDKKNKLLVQAYSYLYAVNEYVLNRDKDIFIGRLTDALHETLFELKFNNKGRYCAQELQIAMMLFHAKDELMNLERLTEYIRNNVWDAEERARILPKALWLLAMKTLEKKQYRKGVMFAMEAKEELAKGGVLGLMPDCLDSILCGAANYENDIDLELIVKQKKALDYLYEMAGVKYSNICYAKVLLNTNQAVFMLASELIRDLRNSEGLSQSDLAEGICEPESLSRIENGGRRSVGNTVPKLLNKLGDEITSFMGMIVADSYDEYVKSWKISRLHGTGNMYEASMLSMYLDDSIPANRQFMEFIEMEHSNEKGIGDEDIEAVINTLSITLPLKNHQLGRVPRRIEISLLLNLANRLKYRENYEKAEEIYKEILRTLSNSRVDNRYRAVPVELFLVNYAGFLETANRLEDSEKFFKLAAVHSVKIQRGDSYGKFAANLSCLYEKMNDKLREQECIENSYYSMLLYHQEKRAQFMRKIYESQFGPL